MPVPSSPLHRIAIGLLPTLFAATAAAAPAGLDLARKHACMACHATSTTLVGPAYTAVAARYAGQADAAQGLVQSIRQGSTGKWGQMAMPPHPQLPAADAQRLADWILRGGQ